MIKKQLKKLFINPLNLVFVNNPASANGIVSILSFMSYW